MILEIVVTHYNEDWSIVEPFFDMIRCQRGADFDNVRIRIVHDGSKPFPQRYFRNMPCQVVQNSIAHAGVSAARNFGMDRADAEWICFCDCDDRYASIYALMTIMSVMNTEDFDVLWNAKFMEVIADGEFMTETCEKFDFVWLHNKYYRLDFLRRNNIRFREDLYMSEDSAFNTLVHFEIGKNRIGQIHSKEPLYTWVYREGSVTLDKKSELRNMIGHHMRNLYVLEEYRKRNHPETNAVAARTMTDGYTNLTKKDLPEGYEKYRDMIVDFVIRERKNIEQVSEKDLQMVLRASEREAAASHFLNPDRPTLKEFVRDLLKEKDVKSG